MATIYHITSQDAWKEAVVKGYYESPSLVEEGFIHCCEENQVEDIKERYFNGKDNLVILTIEADKLTSKLYYDWSPSVANTFPHVYGPINLDAVKGVADV